MKLFRQDSNALVIVVLRFAIGSVFVWFGIDKWIHPDAWVSWIPAWFWPLIPGGDAHLFMFLNGAFEFLVGALLVAGKLIRPASAAAGAFLLVVALSVGINEVTVRDNAMLGSCLALFLHANAMAKRRVPERAIATICTLYVVFLFFFGIAYLRSAA